MALTFHGQIPRFDGGCVLIRTLEAMILSDGLGVVLVLFGSQTGNSEAIASRIHKEISGADSTFCSLLCMKDYEKIDLGLQRLVISVVSTTGSPSHLLFAFSSGACAETVRNACCGTSVCRAYHRP